MLVWIELVVTLDISHRFPGVMGHAWMLSMYTFLSLSISGQIRRSLNPWKSGDW
ncbi:hypothetical protein DL98DRAFT_522694 [Cadophora sp. DSE1049]|nr:hypothetical protein DL98DRAFT_522694 [Cadophora sp. DSE1049]